jgi:hypothetical protein
VCHDVLEKQIRGGAEGNRSAWVAVTDLLYGIGGENAKRVNRAAILVCPVDGHRYLQGVLTGLSFYLA